MTHLIVSEGHVDAVNAAERWINKRSRHLSPHYKLYVQDYGVIVAQDDDESNILYFHKQLTFAIQQREVTHVFVLGHVDQQTHLNQLQEIITLKFPQLEVKVELIA